MKWHIKDGYNKYGRISVCGFQINKKSKYLNRYTFRYKRINPGWKPKICYWCAKGVKNPYRRY